MNENTIRFTILLSGLLLGWALHYFQRMVINAIVICSAASLDETEFIDDPAYFPRRKAMEREKVRAISSAVIFGLLMLMAVVAGGWLISWACVRWGAIALF